LKKYKITLILSKEAKEIIDKKSANLFISKSELVDSLIREFSPSTKEERVYQGKMFCKAFKDFKKIHSDAPFGTIWKHGFHCGWTQFQIRKFSSMFKQLINRG